MRSVAHGLFFSLIWMSFLCLGTFASIVEARELTVADFPSCSLQCMIPIIPTSGCAIDDLNCICKNEKLTEELSACLLDGCTVADIQNTSRVQASLCHFPNDNKQSELFWSLAISYILITLSVALRIIGKFVAKRLSKDDIVLLVAFFLNAVPIGITFTMIDQGLGKHLWNLEDGRLVPIIRFFYIAAIIYIAVLGILKASVILFYIEIFQQTPRFCIVAYSILVLIAANTIILCFVTAFACQPVEAFWNRDVKGTCLSVPGIGNAVGASAIVQDIILLFLPIIFIQTLNMTRARKFAVGCVFSIGAFGCIATALRLKANPNFKESLDPTWNYGAGMMWTDFEACAIYICISLPSIRILIVRIMPGRVKSFFSRISQVSSDKSPQPTTIGHKRPPRSFLSKIFPHSPLWPGFTSRSGRSYGLSSSSTWVNHNESTIGITRVSGDAPQKDDVELQESFQMFRKYWNKESGQVKVESKSQAEV
ncbi:unnamed protein product [Periconia digitata]|uniref:CFEM domain-containing protein n=1 Tax=Periconia digitata TaxID=1303443 RepID=A0A9W4UUN2_9PLEO|nr:unnamed protein product [Periconia digitata]